MFSKNKLHSIFRQKAINGGILFGKAKNCASMKQTEVAIVSSVSTLSKIDSSKCKLLKESLLTNQIVLFFRKNHFIVEAVDEKISIFKSAGLIDYWTSKYEERYPKFETKGPKVLTLYNFFGIFKAWIYFLIIAFFSFCAEIVVKRIMKKYLLRKKSVWV